VASVKISWDGVTSNPSQDSPYRGETKTKLKLRQVCTRNLSHCRGAPQSFAPKLRPSFKGGFRPICLQTCREDVRSIPIARSRFQRSDSVCTVEIPIGYPFGSEAGEGPPQHLLESQIYHADIRQIDS
jgi:hypothetical protein